MCHPTEQSPVLSLELSRSSVAGEVKEQGHVMELTTKSDQICGQCPGSERKERLLGQYAEPDLRSDGSIQTGVS